MSQEFLHMGFLAAGHCNVLLGHTEVPYDALLSYTEEATCPDGLHMQVGHRLKYIPAPCEVYGQPITRLVSCSPLSFGELLQ